MTDAVLLVDDDVNVRAAHRRTLRQFNIKTASNGQEALDLAAQTPFAVVVADMRMPGMDGVRLLARIRDLYPDTVRVMLTGDGETKTAVEAVNEGHIFRFLTKPCPTPALIKTITAALEHHHLVTSERELLEQTLSGVVRVLTDILGIVNPLAFSRTLRIREHVHQATRWLRLPEPWQYDLAAMLSQLGCIGLPVEMLEAVYSGGELSPEDTVRFAGHASLAHDMLRNIPRLQAIARMVGRQHEPPRSGPASPPIASRDPVDIGAALLNASLELDRLMTGGASGVDAIRSMRRRPERFDAAIVTALEASTTVGERPTSRVAMRDLAIGMVVATDVQTRQGLLLVSRGQEVTPALLARLATFMRVASIPHDVEILLPALPAAVS